MTDQFHYIEKQTFLVEFANEEKAMAWQKSIVDFTRNDFPLFLNDLFNTVIPEEDWYHVHKLEVDLGSVTEREFRERLLTEIQSEIRKLVLKSSSRRVRSEGNNDNTSAHLPGTADVLKTATVIRTESLVLIDILLDFLDYGILKHRQEIKNLALLESKILERGINTLVKNSKLKKLLESKWVRERLTLQFSPPFVESLISVFYEKEIEIAKELRTRLLRTVSRMTDTRVHNEIKKIVEAQQVWQLVLDESFEDQQLMDVQLINILHKKILSQVTSTDEKKQYVQFLTEAVSEIKKSFKQTGVTSNSRFLIATIQKILTSLVKLDVEQLVRQKQMSQNQAGDISPVSLLTNVPPTGTSIGKDDTSENKFPKDDSARPPKQNVRNKDSVLKSFKDTSSKESTISKKLIHPDSGSLDNDSVHRQEKLMIESKHISPSIRNIDVSKSIDKQNTSEKNDRVLPEYYVNQAGLVLCWPYLPKLFQHNGYLHDGIFINTSLQERAVHLLGYIATAKEKLEEQDLIMSKLLTGWPLDNPLIKELELSDGEFGEADRMLQSLVSNWAILKDTSIQALRSSFLQREGKIIKEEDGWRLIVEQKSYDLLLEHLPYSLSVIKLPWRSDIIKVDWA